MNRTEIADHPEHHLEMVCQHKRYSVDTREQTGTCYDCGAEGRMRFVVDTAPQPQPKQEPVAWVNNTDIEHVRDYDAPQLVHVWHRSSPLTPDPLYTAPQPQQWVGLTRDEVDELFEDGLGFEPKWTIYQEIEAKLREKNGGGL